MQAYSLDFLRAFTKSKRERSALCFHLSLLLLVALSLKHCSDDDSGGGAPAPVPASEHIHFWLTGIKYNGNLGGIAGANEKCKARAATDASALPGGSAKYTHRALLGTTATQKVTKQL